jgi:hypothetical protein
LMHRRTSSWGQEGYRVSNVPCLSVCLCIRGANARLVASIHRALLLNIHCLPSQSFTYTQYNGTPPLDGDHPSEGI